MSKDLHELSALIEHSPDYEWLDHAACASLGVGQLSTFFVDAGKALSRTAQALCATCPVRRECLTHAYRYEIACGYFAGVSPSRRRVLTLEQALVEIGADSPSAVTA